MIYLLITYVVVGTYVIAGSNFGSQRYEVLQELDVMLVHGDRRAFK